MARENDELIARILDGTHSDADLNTAEGESYRRLRQDFAALREEVPPCTLTFDGVRTAIEKQSAPRRRFVWGWALTPVAAAVLGFLMLRSPNTMTDVLPNPGAADEHPAISGTTVSPTASDLDVVAAATPETNKVLPPKTTFSTIPVTRTKQAPSRKNASKSSNSVPVRAKAVKAAPLDQGDLPEMVASMPPSDMSAKSMERITAEPAVIISREETAQGTSLANEVEPKSDVVVDG